MTTMKEPDSLECHHLHGVLGFYPGKLPATGPGQSPENEQNLSPRRVRLTEAKPCTVFPPAEMAYGKATFTCPGIELASSMAAHNSPLQTWSYRYNVQDTDNEQVGLGVILRWLFILTLNPNTYRNPAAPEWELWVASEDQRLKFELDAT
ncbi:hypothetical protein N7532_010698, partial [Penicillium argentinense]